MSKEISPRKLDALIEHGKECRALMGEISLQLKMSMTKDGYPATTKTLRDAFEKLQHAAFDGKIEAESPEVIGRTSE